MRSPYSTHVDVARLTLTTARARAGSILKRALVALAVTGLAAAAAGAPLILGSGCRGWTSEEPPVHLNWNMDTQLKGKAYYKEEHWKDKRMMRMPVEGTVARGYLNEDDELELGVGADGQPLARLPASDKADTATVAHGRTRYQIYCAPCHGKDYDGKGAVAVRVPAGQPGGLAVPPPSMMDARLVEMPAGKIYQAIRNGVNNGNMPSYAAQMSVKDRWALVAFLCTQQTGKADPMVACAEKKPEVLDPVKDAGKLVWRGRGCNACHSLDGSKMIGPTWKGIYGSTEQTSAGPVTVDDAYLRESIVTPNAKVVNGFQPVMPPGPSLVPPLTDKEMDDVISFIKTLK